MRTGPGTSGRSCFARVSVSKSRIEPSHRFVAVERSDHGGELRTAVATRQRNTKRVEIAADSLQLAHERLRRVVVEAAVRPLAQLAKTRQRQYAVIAGRHLVPRRVENRMSVRLRLGEIACAAQNRDDAQRYADPRRELL